MPSNQEVSSEFTGRFRLPVVPHNPPRAIFKRNRQIVSCIPCRLRKLRCDRKQPCASCLRRQDQPVCQFVSDAASAVGRSPGHGTGAGPGPGSSSSSSSCAPNTKAGRQRKEAQARLQMLEDMVNEWVHDQSEKQQQQDGNDLAASETAPSAAATVEPTIAGPSGGLLRREGDQVRFAGPTSYAAVLEAIRDLKGWVDTATLEQPAPVPPAPQRFSDSPHQIHAETSITIQDVLESLPTRTECDGLLAFYFQQIYIIPVMLHAGHFQRCYEKFWDDPNGTSMLWISILFTLLSTSMFQQALEAHDSGDGSTPSLAPEIKDKITALSSMAHRSLLAGDHLYSKPFCVEATLLFGMHLSLQKRDSEPLCWHMLETAVRLAQRMGYHRDASNLIHGAGAGLSPFEAEMRRRTWYTLEYFDVSYSFGRGVPPIIQAADVDTKLPANLRDDDFNPESTVLPPSRSPVCLTPMLVAIVHARQVQFLRRVVQHTLAASAPLYGDVRRLDAELRALHDEEIPPCMRYRPVRESGFSDVPDVIMRRMACEMLYLKCLCVLHRRYITFEGEKRAGSNDMYEPSRVACREAALRLLALQAEYDEHSAEGGRLFTRRYMLTNPWYHDFLLAAMCLGLDLAAGLQKGSPPPDNDRRIEALKMARAIWARSAHRSKEAAHAADVLEQILSRVSASQNGGASTRRQLPETSSVPASTSSSIGARQGIQTSSEARVHSVVWSFDCLDDLHKRRDQSGRDGVLKGAPVGDNVDWNQIDSFLLDRTTPTTVNVSTGQASQASDQGAREGWPYMNYGSNKEGEVRPNFRTWNGASISGEGPT